MTDDLISLTDDNNVSPTNFGSLGKSIATANRRETAQRDSFSDLAGLMKAKKPYTSIPPPTPKPQLALAANGMRFASRTATGSSLLSPLARPFRAPGSIAAHLHEQEIVSPTAMSSPASVPEYHVDDDDETERLPHAPSPVYREPPLIPELEPPPHIGPIAPPTPAESIEPVSSLLKPDPEPDVRLTKRVWDSMAKDLEILAKQKRKLQEQLSTLERQNKTLSNEDHDVDARLGMLRYQNETNRDQRSAMGRTLGQNSVQIHNQQLEIDSLNKKLAAAERKLKELGGLKGELEYLRGIKTLTEESHTRYVIALTSPKDPKLENVRDANRQLVEKLEHVTAERDTALRAQVNAGDHITRAQTLADTLAKREKIITDLRQKHVAEQLRVTDLEDEVEMLRTKVNQENIDDLKEKLREKSSQCDRQHNQIKIAEQQLKMSQAQILKVADEGVSLRGAAHLVAPNAKGKLPKTVVSCSECYANNLACDNSARCRSCTERGTQCARWRCSLKHRLGQCPDAPCKLPHDAQGWLVLPDARPQW